MIVEKKGNIFANAAGGILVHGCNAMGYMGAGVAAIVREKYPDAFEAYRAFVKDNDNQGRPILGRVHFWPTKSGFIIANAITQYNPGADARLSAINSCFERIFMVSSEMDIPVHTVRVGCGIGGLRWDDVSFEMRLANSEYPSVNCTVWGL